MFPVTTPTECPIEIVDEEGLLGPCDLPTTGWAWYDGSEHEPSLTRACHRHETPGAEDIAALATITLPVPSPHPLSPERIAAAFTLAGLTPENGYDSDELDTLTLAARHGQAIIEELRPQGAPSLPWLLSDILNWWLTDIRFNGGDLAETLDDIEDFITGAQTFTIDDAHSNLEVYDRGRHMLALWSRLTIGMTVRVKDVAGFTVITTNKSDELFDAFAVPH